MRLLLDTNVLSEVTKPRPAEGVLNWLHGLDEDRTFISIISIAEIRRGVSLMDGGRKRDALDERLTHDLPQRFEKGLFRSKRLSPWPGVILWLLPSEVFAGSPPWTA
jgi:hypothetical protein